MILTKFSRFLIAPLALAIFAAGTHGAVPKKPVRIKITTDAGELFATLEDHAAAKDFIAMLPLELTLTDYHRTERIAYLSKKLNVADAPSGYTPVAGDIAYYAPWGNLAIFHRGFAYSAGLVRLGKIDGAIDALRGEEALKARMELVAE